MSVTFTATPAWIPCATTIESWDAELAGLTVSPPEVTMANGNAFQVMQLLGIIASDQEPGLFLGAPLLLPEDACAGDVPAGDFLGRVELALALLDVATDDAHGTPSTMSGGPGTDGPTVISCGREPGYLLGRLTQLREIALYGVAHGCPVSWS